ncbi:hypothetical protein [Aeromicrobium sp.]|uniref:hypothetical protein n=1 Tax=Aeromicrobium sp. TaxID=1871063 RepID=UPI003513A0D2
MPSLISALSALVATALSIFLLFQGQRDRRRLRSERRYEQARLISAWTDWHSDAEMTFAQPRLPAVFISNSSDAAVYDVFVDYRDPVRAELFRVSLESVPPSASKRFVVEFDGPLAKGWTPDHLWAEVNFLDARGKRWIRGFRGRLREDPGAELDDFVRRGGRLLESPDW